MSWGHPAALWLLLLAPLVWWLARRRRSLSDVRVPHLPVLESILDPRDLLPVAPPWRALLLVAAVVAGTGALADPRPTMPAARRVVVLAWGDASALADARALADRAPAGDDVRLLRVRPGGVEPMTTPPRDVDHRHAVLEPARRAAAAAAGSTGHVVEVGRRLDAVAPAPAPVGPPAARPAVVVTALTRAPVPRWLVAALAAMPDLVSRAGQVDRDDLAFALREMPDAFVVGVGVGPVAAPTADWICIAPPAYDARLPLADAEPGVAVGLRFTGAHPIGRGLSAAGIELDDHIPPSPDPRFVPLLLTDRGVAAVAGSLTDTSRCVAICGDPGRAFARYPAWPRFLRRAVAWLATERRDAAHPSRRAGQAECDAALAADLHLPVWRGRTAGATRLPPGEVPLADGRTLRITPDPFVPPPPAPVPPAPLPPRSRVPADRGPALWLALAALAALVAGTIRNPAGNSHAAPGVS